MNRKHLIISHAAVFTVGITAAMVMHGRNDSKSKPQDAENLRISHSRMSNTATLENDAESYRSRKFPTSDGRGISIRDSKTSIERLAGIVRMTDSIERQRAMMGMIDLLGPDDYAAVMDQYRELDHYGDSYAEFDLLIRGWAKANPLAALKYAAQHRHGERTSNTILATWALNDAAGAERWALEHFDGKGANPYMAAVISGIASTDLSHATQLALSMPFGPERLGAVKDITTALFMQSPETAMAYPSTITGDDALRGGFVSAIANRLAAKNPEQAATWLASMDQGELQSRASRNVGEALARTDMNKATTWLQSLKPEAQGEAARGIIPIMSASDIPGTAKWVSSLVGTPGYDNVVEEFVWSCDSRAPEQSAAWIQAVTDPDQRIRLYHRMLGEWAQKDAAAVKQWVSTNNVPDSVLRRFSR